jgi:hypothetical protein
MPQPAAKTLTLRVPLTNAEGKTATFEGVFAVPVNDLLRADREALEAAYIAQFAVHVFRFLAEQGAVWGVTIGQPATEWAKPKPVVVLPGRVA